MREAWGFRVEAVDQKARAIVARKSGIQAAEAGKQARSQVAWSAFGQVLGAGTSLLAARYGFPKPGGGSQGTLTQARAAASAGSFW